MLAMNEEKTERIINKIIELVDDNKKLKYSIFKRMLREKEIFTDEDVEDLAFDKLSDEDFNILLSSMTLEFWDDELIIAYKNKLDPLKSFCQRPVERLCEPWIKEYYN